MFERVTTHYQTLQTWMLHNATCYRNFDVLPHALAYIFSQFNMGMQRITITLTCYYMRYHTFSFSLAWFGVICNALPRVSVTFTKKMYISIFFKKLTVTRCKQPKTRLISEKMYDNICSKACGNAFKLWYGITLRPVHDCRVWQCVVTC